MTKSPVICVTGATGFIGSRVISSLLSHESAGIVALSRHPSSQSRTPRLSWVTGDIGIMTDLELMRFCRGASAVVHLAALVHRQYSTQSQGAVFRAVNVEATNRLAHAAMEAGVNRFIFASSISIYGSISGEIPITRSSALRPESLYAKSKCDAEQKLAALQGAMEISILRCPLVYGYGDPGNFGLLVRAVLMGLPLPILPMTGRRTMLSVDNLAAVISQLSCDDPARPGTFHVCDGEAISTREVVRTIAQAVGKKDVRTLPKALTRLLRYLPGIRPIIGKLNDSLLIEWESSNRELAWSPHVTTRDAVLREASRYVDEQSGKIRTI